MNFMQVDPPKTPATVWRAEAPSQASLRVLVRKLNPSALLPTYGSHGAGCFDLYVPGDFVPRFCPLSESGDLLIVGAEEPIGLGLAFEIPAGFVMLVFSRSGHGFKHNTRLANCVGVIDSDYRGEVMVKLTREYGAGGHHLVVKPGDRIAQALIVPYPRVEFAGTSALSDTARGSGGFGSTGA